MKGSNTLEKNREETWGQPLTWDKMSEFGDQIFILDSITPSPNDNELLKQRLDIFITDENRVSPYCDLF